MRRGVLYCIVSAVGTSFLKCLIVIFQIDVLSRYCVENFVDGRVVVFQLQERDGIVREDEGY